MKNWLKQNKNPEPEDFIEDFEVNKAK